MKRLSTRGCNCTSIDALIYDKHKNGEKWLIPIVWKYTEYYYSQNKAAEVDTKTGKDKGKVRQNRYTELINSSKQLKSENHYCYYFEPFYQLMRQTLWAEQMVSNKDIEIIKADNYLHVHVILEENSDMINKNYKCSDNDMETTWRKHLKDNSKYTIISPDELMKNIDKEKYSELINYLKKRYWEV